MQMKVVCRNNCLTIDDNKWFKEIGEKVTIYFNDSLHAKCFLNENTAIVTSMNLYHYSMVNNVEFGVLFERKDDPENYSKILEESSSLIGYNFQKQEEISKVRIVELAEYIKADSCKLVKDANGNEYLHILNTKTKNYFSVKVGDDIVLKSKGIERITELVNSYVIYTGQSQNGVWFRFGNDQR